MPLFFTKCKKRKIITMYQTLKRLLSVRYKYKLYINKKNNNNSVERWSKVRGTPSQRKNQKWPINK